MGPRQLKHRKPRGVLAAILLAGPRIDDVATGNRELEERTGAGAFVVRGRSALVGDRDELGGGAELIAQNGRVIVGVEQLADRDGADVGLRADQGQGGLALVAPHGAVLHSRDAVGDVFVGEAAQQNGALAEIDAGALLGRCGVGPGDLGQGGVGVPVAALVAGEYAGDGEQGARLGGRRLVSVSWGA